MGFFKNLFGKKKEEPEDFPFHYYLIVWTETAIHEGIFDDYNKEIQIFEGNTEVPVEVIPYTKSDLDSIKKVYKIPGKDLTKTNVEDLQFEEMDSLSGEYREVRN